MNYEQLNKAFRRLEANSQDQVVVNEEALEAFMSGMSLQDYVAKTASRRYGMSMPARMVNDLKKEHKK